MNDDFVLLDEEKSLPWNYVMRVEKELTLNGDYEKVMINHLLPNSYREVVSILSKACNHSRVALLLDEFEEYVAFLLVVDEDCIPFLLDDLSEVEFPIKAVYKVFYNTPLATSHISTGELQQFISDTVLPDLNTDFSSWTYFKYNNK